MADRSVNALLGEAEASKAPPSGDRSVEDLLGEAPANSSVPGAAWRKFAHGATSGASPMIVGAGDALSGAFSGKSMGETYRASRDKREAQLATDAEEHPNVSTAADVLGTLATTRGLSVGKGIGGAVKFGAGLGGTRGYLESKGQQPGEDDREAGMRQMAETALGTALGGALGGASHIVAKPIAAGIGWLGNKLLPRAQAFEQRATNAVADKAAAAAEATARSAQGSLGAVSREGSSTLRDLAQGVTNPALPTAEQAANRAVLSRPEAQALASDLAGKARARLPDQLAHIDSARSLAQQTAQEATQARVQGSTVDYAKQSLVDKMGAQTKRYVPEIAGGAIGSLAGGDEHRLSGFAIGAGGTRVAAPMLRAYGRTLTGAEGQRLAGTAFRSMAEKMAGLAQTQPQLAGKFGPVLLNARQRGPDALSVAHYQLSQNPDYQALQRQASLETE